MCGGGPSGPSEEDKKEADERHQENLALQREQMAEQKRQFELSRQDNQARYREQKAASKAAPPPAPEKTAGVASNSTPQVLEQINSVQNSNTIWSILH